MVANLIERLPITSTAVENDGQWETIASAFPAISCLDQADFGLKHARQEWPHEIAKAPTLGKALGGGTDL